MTIVHDIEVRYNEHGRVLCSARRKRCRKCEYVYNSETDRDVWVCPQCGETRWCEQPVDEAGLRCRYHGGDTPKGLAAHNFRHGRYSRYMPTRLSEQYEQAVSDPELLSIREDIALVDARIADLQQRLEQSEAGAVWKQAKDSFRAFRQATARGDPGAVRVHLGELDDLLSKGAGDAAAWEQILGAIEQRRKLVETEMRRLEKMRNFITAEQLQMLLAAISEIIKRNVQDPETLKQIGGELIDLRQGRWAASPDRVAMRELPVDGDEAED